MSKKYYIAITEDSSVDVEVSLFDNREHAIEWAKAESIEIAQTNRDEYQEEEIKGWEFYATFSCEGDSIRVVETELLKKVK